MESVYFSCSGSLEASVFCRCISLLSTHCDPFSEGVLCDLVNRDAVVPFTVMPSLSIAPRTIVVEHILCKFRKNTHVIWGDMNIAQQIHSNKQIPWDTIATESCCT